MGFDHPLILGKASYSVKTANVFGKKEERQFAWTEVAQDCYSEEPPSPNTPTIAPGMLKQVESLLDDEDLPKTNKERRGSRNLLGMF